ncbi:glycoside hydrolase family 76 protein [Periconia macrospinosa]|uniref:Mannan endo-1,6-alpha-mannosidase n=1 Tax=Periconia macrospinosa TaxID=97972 RepID=A0A2V1D7P1_9PLEO|nr:glycoside hydrolase family 76 protein [Periconia macrospinosa]
MKFASTALGALGASVLLSSAGALDLDINSEDSIKKVASQVAAGMRKVYTGDKPGDVPGNLPDPYYWWECGAMFGALIDYWYYTGDDQYNNITIQAMKHQIGEEIIAFMPQNQTKTLGNDDQAFWGMAAMSAAENKLPDMKDGPSWLALAQGVYNTQVERWSNTCGGGLNWQIFKFNQGFTYKNTISNGCFFNIAARLYKYTGNVTYGVEAEKHWDWEVKTKLFEVKDGGYHFYDGADERDNCQKIEPIQWTYNIGVHLAGATAMWNASIAANNQTQKDRWAKEIDLLIKGLDIFFPDGIMKEVACEDIGTCNTDQRSFKAYLSRWMGYAILTARELTFKDLWARIQKSAPAAAKNCVSATDTEANCDLKWNPSATKDGKTGVGENMSVLEIVQALLVNKAPGPVTQQTGGTSKSDPSAGGGIMSPPVVLNPVTTAGRAGAGILTALVLGATIGGAWWLVT